MPAGRGKGGVLELSEVAREVLACIVYAPRAASAAEIVAAMKDARGRAVPVHLVTASITLALRNAWVIRVAGVGPKRYEATDNGRVALRAANSRSA